MIRYAIQFNKPGSMLKTHGMVETMVACTGSKAEVVVYVADKNSTEWEKYLDSAECVDSYVAHPLDLKGRVRAAKGGA